MGKDASAFVSYGFVIDQPDVLKLLQELQGSEKPVEPKSFRCEDEYLNELLCKKPVEPKSFRCEDAEYLNELLCKHLKGVEEDFDFLYLTSGDDDFKGMAIVSKGIGDRLMVWGFGSQNIQPLSSGPGDDDGMDEANTAFERLSEDPLFQKLEIEADPEWLLGCNMTQ